MKNSQSAVDFMMILTLVGILFMLCGSGDDGYLKIFIRQLQIVLNLPLFRIAFAANFLEFVGICMQVAMFDFMESFFDWDDYPEVEF